MQQKNLLKLLRILAGLTQEDLACIVGLSQSSIARVEANKRRLTRNERLKLANFFKVNPEVIGIAHEDKKLSVRNC